MRDRANVVIVGAGVIGASVAWHLTALGVRDVLLVDRAASAGEGSTGRATGGVRAPFGTSINVRPSLPPRGKLRPFARGGGAEPRDPPSGGPWVPPPAAAPAGGRRAPRRG